MNICVLSKDLRYKALSNLLVANGYILLENTKDGLMKCDVLILSVTLEYTENEIKEVGRLLKSEAIVFSGNGEMVSSLIGRDVIDYSKNNEFLQRNAELTSEACLSLLYNELKMSLKGQRILVTGYGRIGKSLCGILESLGADVYVYARREEMQREASGLGYKIVKLDNLPKLDIVLNTVPQRIISKNLTDSRLKNTVLVELASKPGGYEDKSMVIDGGRLPGRILPISAAEIIYNTIVKYFPYRKG